jgi:hypothetical protein
MCWQRHDQFRRSERAAALAGRSDHRRERSTGTRPPDEVRVSDAERQAVIDDLRQHTVDGRLTLDEFEQRVEEALQARTGGELWAATRELPSLHRPSPSRRRRSARIRFSPGMFVVVAVAVVALVPAAWWVLIPLWFLTVGGCGSRGRHAASRRGAARDETLTYV